MSCSAPANLSQDMLWSTLHSSESYAQSFGSFLPRCSEEQGYLQSLQTSLFLHRLLNDGVEKYLDTTQQSEVKQQEPQMSAVII